MQKHHVILLLASSTFVAITSALVLRRRRKIQLEQQLARQAKLKQFQQDQDFSDEISICHLNKHPEKVLFERIDEYIQENYAKDEIPNFNLLMLIMKLMQTDGEDSNSGKLKIPYPREELAVKTIKQMKEYIASRKQRSASTSSTSTAATAATADIVQDPYELTIEEQEFALGFYKLMVNEMLIAGNGRYLEPLLKYTEEALNAHPEAPFILEKRTEFPYTSKQLVQKLIDVCSKDPKRYRRQLGISYSRLSMQSTTPEETLEFVNKILEHIPDANTYADRFVYYHHNLSGLPEAERAKYQEYATDDERAMKYTGNPRDVLLRISELWKHQDVFRKYYDTFLKYDMDLEIRVMKQFYCYHVYHGEFDTFLNLLESRIAYCRAIKPKEFDIFHRSCYILKLEIQLRKLAFEDCMTTLEQYKSMLEHSSRQLQDINEVTTLLITLFDTWSKYPIFQETYEQIKQQVLQEHKYPTVADLCCHFKTMQTPPDDHEELKNIGMGILLAAYACIPSTLDQLLDILARANCAQNVQQAFKLSKFTRGDHVAALMLFPEKVVRLVGEKTIDEIVAAILHTTTCS